MKLYLGLGTNLGDKEHNLQTAVDRIGERVGKVLALSSFHATAPWGFASEHTFLNAVLCVEVKDTTAPQEALLRVLDTTQQIEREMGRITKSTDGVYHDRVIDIDLLLCLRGDGTSLALDLPGLRLPHPLMWERDFVMRPLREIAGEEIGV